MGDGLGVFLHALSKERCVWKHSRGRPNANRGGKKRIKEGENRAVIAREGSFEGRGQKTREQSNGSKNDDDFH